MKKGSKSDKIIIDTIENDEFMGDLLDNHYPPEQKIISELETDSLKQCYEFQLDSIQEEHGLVAHPRTVVSYEEYMEHINLQERMEAELLEDDKEEHENNIPDHSMEETSR